MVSSWERALGMRRGQANVRRDVADMQRELDEARRQQSEARVAQARRDREERARAAAERMLPPQDLFTGSGTGRDYRLEPMTPEESAARRAAFMAVVFGPERESVLPGEQQASLPERLVRDWGLSEQEFRLAGERAGEGRFGPAAGWAAFGLAGAFPFFGDVAQGLGRAGRVASQAADARGVARVAPRPSVGGPREASAFPRVLEYPDKFVPQDFPALRQVRTIPAPGSRQRGVGTILDLDSSRGDVRLFHGTDGQNVSSILETGIRPSTAGEAKGLFASPELATAARYGSDGRKSYVVEFVTKPENVLADSELLFPGLRHFVVDEVSSPQIAAVHVFDYSGAGTARITDSYIVNPEYGSALEDFGVVPRLGTTNPLDVPTELQLVEELGRGRVRTPRAGQAADVGRAGRGTNIVDDLAQERASTGDIAVREGLPQSDTSLRTMREILRRQEFDQTPARVSTEEFGQLAQSGEYTPLYRGVYGAEGGAARAMDFAEDLTGGELFVGTGTFGPGVYLATRPQYSLSYAAGTNRVPGNGAFARFLLPEDANLLDVPLAAGRTTGPDLSLYPPEVVAGFERSGLSSINEYLAAAGYDGIRVIGRNNAPREVVLFNRGALVTDGPRAVGVDEAAAFNRGMTTGNYDEVVDMLYPRGAQ